MTVHGTSRSSRANALVHSDAVSKSPDASFRKVYETTERKLALEARAPHVEPGPPPISGADRAALDAFVEANRRTESGGDATFSALATTAGSGHRASFGVAQLTTREHLERLSRLDDATLTTLGTSRSEVAAMSARGDAAIAFYRLLVGERAPDAVIDLSPQEASRALSMASTGDAPGLEQLLGARFEASTGLPQSALGEMIATRALRDRELRDAFRAQYEHDHGVAFDRTDRETSRMAISARHVALAHPALDGAVRALGDDDAGMLALGHYLGVGDTAENMLGWHARAASTVPGSERFARLLTAADPITSRAREEDDFARAVAAAAGAADLDGDARVVVLARLGRLFHGAPARARDRLFVDGRYDAPRFRSRAELEAAITELRAGRSWSDERLLENLTQVLAERSTT